MTSSLPLIGIIIGSTLEARFGEKHEQWIYEIAKQRKDLVIELIDLGTHSPPFLDEPTSPNWTGAKKQAAQAWADRFSPLDGLIVVTPEYDHGTSLELKKTFDYAYKELARKPIGFVGYGGTGRAIEQMRLIAIELQMVPVRNAVHIGIAEFVGIWQQGKSFADYTHLAQAANSLLDELAWWARALQTPRATQ
ncbi:FMN reductase [Pseudomonas chlororaphis]|nr:FMN reductase [Pseudomonas chlororaphis]